MYIWFSVFVLGELLLLPLYFFSVEHIKLQEKYGEKKGKRIGEILGLLSGWGFFLFWIGIWISPQPNFIIPSFQTSLIFIPLVNALVPVQHIIISSFFLPLGAWFGIKGVQGTTLRAAETHRTNRIATNGVYARVRHPQYLGGLLAHIGISFLFSAEFSLLVTPIMIALICLISLKEEQELLREFGKEYEDYKKKVPMLIPKLRK